MEKKYKVIVKVGVVIVFEGWVKANTRYLRGIFEESAKNRIKKLVREFNRGD